MELSYVIFGGPGGCFTNIPQSDSPSLLVKQAPVFFVCGWGGGAREPFGQK